MGEELNNAYKFSFKLKNKNTMSKSDIIEIKDDELED